MVLAVGSSGEHSIPRGTRIKTVTGRINEKRFLKKAFIFPVVD